MGYTETTEMNGILLCFFLTIGSVLTFRFSMDVLYEEFYDLGLILFVLSLTVLRTAMGVAEVLDSRNL